MWPSMLCSLRVCSTIAWSASRTGVHSSLLKRRLTQRLNVLVSCVHGKDSAIKHLLGVNEETTSSDHLCQHPPAVSYDKVEHDSLLIHRPDQPVNAKVLRIAIIGAPNAGKSTLSNQLLGRKVFPVSKKVHTTRCQAQGVITEGETQLILLDTPGMVTASKVKRHNLEKSLLHDPWQSMESADLVLVLLDVSDHWTRCSLNFEVLKCLSQYQNIPSILVMNKVDLIKQKGILLDLTNQLTEGIVNGKKIVIKSLAKASQNRDAKANVASSPSTQIQDDTGPLKESNLVTESPQVTGDSAASISERNQDFRDLKGKKGWPHFQDVFMLSAVNGDEVQTLKRYLMSLAKPGEWEYHSDVVTSQSPQEICNNIIREKLLEYLPQEVPYNVSQITEVWEEGPGGELVILQTLLVQKENHVKLLIGVGGQMIKRIALEAGQDLMNVFLCDVRVRLSVKVKK
ncbi:GTPase Era, mitochondrial [Xenopus laevis]|uniref:GTPase Era, mitochondrial n=2 Tax=Xenopus laevis TaxID=8355 RepID=A0A974DCC1_XENLA|nr:GTPase Era, mitochondrial [Xenopus laevis]OCT88765.1 hypothetical protein XELAEV_18017394mg [Xenopus laevis]